MKVVTWIVTFCPSFRLVPFALAVKSSGIQNLPSPFTWKNGTTCEKLLNDVGFAAEETKTPPSSSMSSVRGKERETKLTGPLWMLGVEGEEPPA